jgi:cytochrome P450
LKICNVELITNWRNLGTYGCIGKPLALMQMRTIVAKLIMKFDVSFAPGEDGTRLIEKTRDHFSLGLADFNLVFTERQV